MQRVPVGPCFRVAAAALPATGQRLGPPSLRTKICRGCCSPNSQVCDRARWQEPQILTVQNRSRWMPPRLSVSD